MKVTFVVVLLVAAFIWGAAIEGMHCEGRMKTSKEEYLAYRERAQQIVKDDKRLSVSHLATVHPGEDGAFVEATIWVPKTEIKEKMR